MRGPLVGLMLATSALATCADGESPREAFVERVVPVLEARCTSSSCHGVAPGAEARGERIDWGQLFVRVDEAGRIADVDQAYEACKRVINTTEDPELSSLLRKPLSPSAGGLGHLGGHDFSSPADPPFQAIKSWVALERGGGEDPPPLTALERRFAEEVQPVLVEATCFTSRCHGPTAGATPYHLDTGYRGKLSVEATRHNYRETLAMVTLDGHAGASRLVRKAAPLGEGVTHKGANFDFFAGNPGGGRAAIEAWICAERAARVGVGCAVAGEPSAPSFVYVRGPAPPHHPFDLGVFAPGSDIYLASMAAPSRGENLTAALHPEKPADVRDPAVSRDGTRLLFSMRAGADEGHRLWLLDLRTREARPLTAGHRREGGPATSDRDPTWGPGDSVWFVSTRAGVVADQGALLDAEVYSLDLATGATRRWTYTPHVERKPVFFDIGIEAGGQVAFSALRDAIPAQARAHVFRFPPNMSTEYHQHFGITPEQTFFYDMRELPDGRYVSVVGDLPAPWHGGRLGVIDRNLGPELRAGAAALESYAPPLVVLDGDGVFRDPSPLPDGRVLVAHQPGPFGDGDAGAAFAPRIELLELDERRDGGGPFVAKATVLLDEPGVALTDPEPIALRAPVRAEGALAESSEATAIFRHQGVPMIDALLSNLAPSGPRRPRGDIAHVRLVESLQLAPDQRRPLGPGGGATTAALGPHGPSRVLAEIPLAADGSFEVRVPVNTPFRLQALDRDRMAVGAMHNRWYYVLPGQTLTQGVPAAAEGRRYGSMCAACHGNVDGEPGEPPQHDTPDAITGASLTLARFDQQHPRRPLTPRVLGDETRIEVDFARDVQPTLDRRCGRCHAGPAPAAGLDLAGTPTAHFSVAYESLLRAGEGSGGGRAYVDDGDGRARSSFVVELLLGRELEAPRALSRPGEPHTAGGEALTEGELLTLIRWIELGATFIGGVGR